MRRILALMLICVLLTGCGNITKDTQAGTVSSRTVLSMDTVMQLSAYGKNREEALDRAEAEILRLNDLLSTGLESSEISRLNREGSGQLSDDTLFLTRRALSLWESTGGAFDITVYPLVQLWGFPTKEYHVPTGEELTDALTRIDSGRLALAEDGMLTLGEGQAIDLGGIAKGYTSGRIMDIYKEAGIQSGMVSLGGNVHCLGTKPDGSPWRIGIQNPFDPSGDVYAIVQAADEAVITSGGYERFFEENGQIYLHILDPHTGYPADSGLASVTIVTKDGTLGDGLSTSLFILGLEAAADYWRSYSEAFDAIFITDDGTLYATAGLEGRIISDHPISIIQK